PPCLLILVVGVIFGRIFVGKNQMGCSWDSKDLGVQKLRGGCRVVIIRRRRARNLVFGVVEHTGNKEEVSHTKKESNDVSGLKELPYIRKQHNKRSGTLIETIRLSFEDGEGNDKGKNTNEERGITKDKELQNTFKEVLRSYLSIGHSERVALHPKAGPTSQSATSINQVTRNDDNKNDSSSLQDQILDHVFSLKALIKQHNKRSGTLIEPIRLSFEDGKGNDKGKNTNEERGITKDKELQNTFKEMTMFLVLWERQTKEMADAHVAQNVSANTRWPNKRLVRLVTNHVHTQLGGSTREVHKKEKASPKVVGFDLNSSRSCRSVKRASVTRTNEKASPKAVRFDHKSTHCGAALIP
nr:hypothetical protein [Tanacetum cinerariifolium]